MTKIEALEKTIYNLENNVYKYQWDNSSSCNCGVLAKTLLNGKDVWAAGYADSPIEGSEGIFSRKAFCITTNLPLPEVFQALKDAGFTYDELLELEFLANDEIASRVGFKVWIHDGIKGAHGDFSVKKHLISYLKEWVEILKEQSPQMLSKGQKVQECDATKTSKETEAGPKIIHHYHKVTVPESIETKEFILS